MVEFNPKYNLNHAVWFMKDNKTKLDFIDDIICEYKSIEIDHDTCERANIKQISYVINGNILKENEVFTTKNELLDILR